jgi:hypothetical protein
MTRLHFIVTRKGEKVALAYAGESGSAADAAYDNAKGCDSVEHYRFPEPARVRSADVAARSTKIRDRSDKPEPASEKPAAEPAKK